MNNSLKSAREELVRRQRALEDQTSMQLLKRKISDFLDANLDDSCPKRPRLAIIVRTEDDESSRLEAGLFVSPELARERSRVPEITQADVDEANAKVVDDEQVIAKLQSEIMQAKLNVRELECDLMSARKRINAFCALKRSEVRVYVLNAVGYIMTLLSSPQGNASRRTSRTVSSKITVSSYSHVNDTHVIHLLTQFYRHCGRGWYVSRVPAGESAHSLAVIQISQCSRFRLGTIGS